MAPGSARRAGGALLLVAAVAFAPPGTAPAQTTTARCALALNKLERADRGLVQARRAVRRARGAKARKRAAGRVRAARMALARAADRVDGRCGEAFGGPPLDAGLPVDLGGAPLDAGLPVDLGGAPLDGGLLPGSTGSASELPGGGDPNPGGAPAGGGPPASCRPSAAPTLAPQSPSPSLRAWHGTRFPVPDAEGRITVAPGQAMPLGFDIAFDRAFEPDAFVLRSNTAGAIDAYVQRSDATGADWLGTTAPNDATVGYFRGQLAVPACAAAGEYLMHWRVVDRHTGEWAHLEPSFKLVVP